VECDVVLTYSYYHRFKETYRLHIEDYASEDGGNTILRDTGNDLQDHNPEDDDWRLHSHETEKMACS
jgi:hypothetical protein